jgi:hypothetical protein
MKFIPTLVALLLAISTQALHAADTWLIDNGQAHAQIVIAEKPARMTKLAAKELQTYLKKISGAEVPIVTQPSGNAVRILVGKSSHTDALKLSTDGLEHGAFRMASGPDWLALLGPDEDFVPIEPWGRNRDRAETDRVHKEWDKITGDMFWNNCRELYIRHHEDLGVWDYDDAGTLNAVYEFLRGLGVRWFAPGEIGEVTPQHKSIALPTVNKTVKPDFALRKFMFYTDHSGLGDKAIWMLRLGLNQGHKLVGVTQPCHGIKFVLMRDEMKKGHPEMYLSIGGKPDFTHHGVGVPNVLSPMLMEKHVKYARAMFDHFHEPVLNIDMVDGYGGLSGDDPAWQALLTPERGWEGAMSDQVWGYLNQVALQLNQSHPDRVVCGLSYSGYKLPPEKIATMSPNLALIETRSRKLFWDESLRAHHRELREAWLKKLPSHKYFTWDSCSTARPDTAGRPVVFTKQIAQDLRELKGVTLGEMIEIYDHPAGQESRFGYHPLAFDHLHLYLTSRFWWDADQDLDAVLADYYHAYYGPAASAMQAYLEYCEANWMHMAQDADRIRRSFELLAAAHSAVDPASVYGRRVQQIADYVKPMRTLQEQLSRKHESDLSYRVLLTSNTGGKPMKTKPLDGQVLKEYWTDVRTAQLVSLMPKGPRPKAATHFQVQREGETLYFGIVCQEPDMAGLKIGTTTSGDPKLFDGDYVTLLIETPTRSYYEIAVNPAGAVFEIDRGPGAPATWTSGSRIAVHRGDSEWSIEIRLPIVGEEAHVLDPHKGIDGAQPKDLFPWYFNLGRQRVRGNDLERSAYSPTGKDDFRVTEKFAKLWGK